MAIKLLVLVIFTSMQILSCQEDPATEKKIGPVTLFVTSDNGLVMREGPSVRAQALKTLPFRARVTFLEDGPTETIAGRSSSWKKVTFDNLTGYAFGGFLSTVEPALPRLWAELIGGSWGPEEFAFGVYTSFDADGT